MTKTALITGTSSGVGLSLAVLLAQRGFSTYATMRNIGKSEALQAAAADADVELHIRQLDVQDAESVERCVAELVAETGRVDVLVNNAGAGFVRTTEQATEDEVNWVMDVNFHGVVRCTKAVLPHMRTARSGHIVNVTSVGGLVGQPFNEFYCAAKFAVEGYTEAMASYIEPNFGIHFTAVEPGGIRTAFSANVLQQFAESGGMRDDAYKPILESYIGGVQRRAMEEPNVAQTPEEVAIVIADCIESDDPPIRMRTSAWAEQLCHLKTGLDPDGRKLQAKVVADFL